MADRPTVLLSGELGDRYELLLGTRELPIIAPHVEACELTGIGEHACVMLDVAALSDDQIQRLCSYLGQKFQDPPELVEKQLRTDGLPIRLGPETEVKVPDGYRPARRKDIGARIHMRMF